MQCPKCRAPLGESSTGDGLTLDLCPACNAVWFDADGLAGIARRFDGLHTLAVKQRRKWMEMLTGFEQTNEYNVIGNGLGSAFHVQEQSAGGMELVRRLLLGPWRPFVAHVEDLRRGTRAMRLVRPFRWFFPELEVRDADGALLATIARRWTWLHTRLDGSPGRGAVDARLASAGRQIPTPSALDWEPTC